MYKKHWWKMGTIATNAKPDEIRAKIGALAPACAFQLSAGHNFEGRTDLPVHYHVEFDMEVYRNRAAAEGAWREFTEVATKAWPPGSKNEIKALA